MLFLLFGSLDNRLCRELAWDRREPLDVDIAISRHRDEACAAAQLSVGRVRILAEVIGNRPMRRHRQLFLGLFKIVGVYQGVGGGDAAA
jgi:hypothetical protein